MFSQILYQLLVPFYGLVRDQSGLALPGTLAVSAIATAAAVSA